jgi:hypothetical protein
MLNGEKFPRVMMTQNRITVIITRGNFSPLSMAKMHDFMATHLACGAKGEREERRRGGVGVPRYGWGVWGLKQKDT